MHPRADRSASSRPEQIRAGITVCLTEGQLSRAECRRVPHGGRGMSRDPTATFARGANRRSPRNHALSGTARRMTFDSGPGMRCSACSLCSDVMRDAGAKRRGTLLIAVRAEPSGRGHSIDACSRLLKRRKGSTGVRGRSDVGYARDACISPPAPELTSSTRRCSTRCETRRIRCWRCRPSGSPLRTAIQHPTGSRRAHEQTIDDDGHATTVRVYDRAHGINEMHRFDRYGGKALGETVHAGTLGEGMRAAITTVRTGHKEMIEAWRAT